MAADVAELQRQLQQANAAAEQAMSVARFMVNGAVTLLTNNKRCVHDMCMSSDPVLAQMQSSRLRLSMLLLCMLCLLRWAVNSTDPGVLTGALANTHWRSMTLTDEEQRALETIRRWCGIQHQPAQGDMAFQGPA